MSVSAESSSLKRSMNLLTLSFYGLGTIIGAGIYVLIGELADTAGQYMPVSFLLAGAIALLTGLSYCELSSRYPICAGVSVYVDRAWGLNWLSALCGWLIILTGIVSAAAISNGFAGYLGVFVELEAHWAIIFLCLVLGLIAVFGIRLSAATVFLVTTIEVAGLAYIVWITYGMEPLATQNTATQAGADPAFSGILLGSFLAFYAFIGFEDMVNVVEEVKRPRVNMPLGIILSIALASICYMVVAFAVLRVSSPADLAAGNAPLADLVERSGRDPGFIGGISLLAVINGALVQIIMASRVLYGMGKMQLAPAGLAQIAGKTRTPIFATGLVTAMVMVFALLLPLESLARLTSAVMLVIFAIVNLALIVIKSRSANTQAGFSIPVLIPALGILSSLFLLGYQIWNLF